MIITNQDSLSRFFDLYYRNAVIQAIRIIKDQGVAEDVVMECLMKLWDNRMALSEKGDVEAYFFRMVRNKSIDQIRKKKVVELVEVTESVRVNDALEIEELGRQIDTIIDSLPERCRQVFVLSRYESMSNKAIAEQLEISIKTVENQMTKALKTLRLRIKPFLSFFFY